MLPNKRAIAALAVAACCLSAQAATLPGHAPLDLLIVADEVNPHRLGDAELTQPQDLEPALKAPESALNLESIQTVDSSNDLRVDQQAPFAGTGAVAAGSYPYFTNVPDELYADTVLLEEAGEQRTPLFATDSLGERLLDDRDGVNYQILVNAIYYAAFGD